VALTNLGRLNADENHNAEARNSFEEALAIYREFAVHAPATYQPRVLDVEKKLRLLPP
jgi:hypothetical protein